MFNSNTIFWRQLKVVDQRSYEPLSIWVDRFGSRQTMVQTQYLVLGVWTTILLMLWLDNLATWHLGLATFIIGVTWTVNAPARSILIPNLVGPSRTVEAMIIENFTLGVIAIAGPYLTGWQLDTFGPSGVFLFF